MFVMAQGLPPSPLHVGLFSPRAGEAPTWPVVTSYPSLDPNATPTETTGDCAGLTQPQHLTSRGVSGPGRAPDNSP